MSNTLTDADAKQKCFCAALEHALSSGQPGLVVAAVQRLDALVRAWKLSPTQARSLYLQGARVM